MGKTILLSSTKGGSGKSVIAIGLFLTLKEKGINPGYFKPIGDKMSLEPKSKTDKDVSVISAVVARKFSKEEICPQFFNPDLFLDEVLPEETEGIMQKIKDAYESIKSKTDYMIIEGNHSGYQYRVINLDDTRMAKEFGASIIICAPIGDDDDLNDIVGLYDFYKGLGLEVAGVILNGTNEMAFARIDKYHKPLLEKRGITVIGGLKESRQLAKPTVAEVLDAVSAKLLAGNFVKVKNNLIDGFMIGAMSAETALSYLRKGINQCVITGGDRSDVALAALETNTALLILTGGIEPAPFILGVAEEKGIPVALAVNDTFTVSEQIRKINTHIQPNEIILCKEQVDKYIDFDKIPQ
jgi:uncharacterized protein